MQQIDIGDIIRDELRRQGHSNTWLATRIGITPRATQKIFLKRGIDTRQLLLISRALGRDFFRLYSELLESESIGKTEHP